MAFFVEESRYLAPQDAGRPSDEYRLHNLLLPLAIYQDCPLCVGMTPLSETWRIADQTILLTNWDLGTTGSAGKMYSLATLARRITRFALLDRKLFRATAVRHEWDHPSVLRR